MFWFKRKKINTHEHKYTQIIGFYYKVIKTEYANCFDTVKIYKRKQCDCGDYTDICIASNDFLPSLYFSDYDIKNFTNGLKERGVKEEYEFNLVL